MLSAPFISAYSYDTFSLSNFLDNIDESTLILGALFLIFFAVINLSLGKVFKNRDNTQNKAVTGVVSFAISLLIVYSINKSGIDYQNFIYDLGVSGNSLDSTILVVFIIGAILLVWKLKANALLMIGGLFLLVAFFTDLVYEEEILIALGFILVIVGVAFKIWWFKNQEKFGHRTLGWR